MVDYCYRLFVSVEVHMKNTAPVGFCNNLPERTYDTYY